MAGHSRSSFVWAIFKLCDDSDTYAECKICKRLIKRGHESAGQKTFSTTPLHNHAKMKHPDEYETAKQANRGCFASVSTFGEEGTPKDRKISAIKKQLSIQESFEARKIWDINDSRAKDINRAVMIMMAVDNQPFSIVEDDGFIDLVAKLQPRYLLPSRRYFSDAMLPRLYDEVKGKVLSELESCDGSYVSFTSDIWTCSSSQETFVSLSGHWIKSNFQRRDVVLKAAHFPASHSGINISEMLTKMWNEWNLVRSRRHLLIRDGASNMTLGCELADIPAVHCTIHRLQLVVSDAIRSQPAVNALLTKCRRLVTHFGHSSVACTTLKELQRAEGLQPRLLVQDVPTRWNSSYLMVQRLVELKRPVLLYLADHEDLPQMTASDWQLCGSLLHVLKPFFDLTKEMSSDNATLSSVIPNITCLELYLTKIDQKAAGAQKLRESLLQALRLRFLTTADRSKAMNILLEKHYVTATAIDPRYKLNFFKKSEEKDNAKTLLLSEVLQLLGAQDEEVAATDSKCADSPASSTGSSGEEDLFGSCFTQMVSQGQAPAAKRQRRDGQGDLKTAAEEVQNFFTLPLSPREMDPVQWWDETGRSSSFPRLRALSRKLLSAPSSSVFSERMFSEYGTIFEDRRSRLLPRRGEQLLFLHHNVKHF